MPISQPAATAQRVRHHPADLEVGSVVVGDGQRVDVPSIQVSKFDIIDVRPKSVETQPFEIARETFGERPVPAWMKVVPGSLRVLIFDRPVREQIDTVLTEQLIVELYSKN